MAEPDLLHTTTVGATPAARQRIVMLHGIYGRGRNWQTIARELCTARPDWSALLVDLRLHGDSPAMSPPHTLASAADDVLRLMEAVEQDGPPVRAVLGHSYGGKVALAIAARVNASQAGTPRLRQVWIVDTQPGTQPPSGSAWKMLTDVRSLPSTFPSRQEAIAAFERAGWTTGVASWMGTNLRYVDGVFRWTLDFDAMEALLESYFTTDLWSVIESPPPGLDVHIIKATESSTIDETACARITRAEQQHGRVHLHRVEGSHWLNTDNPSALIELLTQNLRLVGG